MIYVLKGLVPYTQENIKLSFKPSLFFKDLERISGKKPSSLKNAYYSAKQDGLIRFDDNGNPYLSEQAQQKISPLQSKKLGSGAHLMVIFDIPEAERYKRRQFRRLLQALSFTQIQKSVWESPEDHKNIIHEAISDMKLADYVVMYEALKINK